jgi:hypothetical protein
LVCKPGGGQGDFEDKKNLQAQGEKSKNAKEKKRKKTKGCNKFPFVTGNYTQLAAGTYVAYLNNFTSTVHVSDSVHIEGGKNEF